MKKIPTLFERKFDDKGHIIEITPKVKEGFEWVLNGEGEATLKVDGSCCAVIDYQFYRRYDAKKGKAIPEGAIKCQEEADSVTGHLPCWVKVNDTPNDKWYFKAYQNYLNDYGMIENGTYEAIGQHFQGNPYNLTEDTLVKHGETVLEVERTFEGIKKYLHDHYIEGIVFWKDGEPRCKIKRTDFGFEWNGKNKR